ncbi:hypothetical protein [Phenylobacterium sp.]|uniref:hypothetical protein n=1 Tax=Phenylobacterium sp. TaxID=1871053 RepID=UPI002F425FDF
MTATGLVLETGAGSSLRPARAGLSVSMSISLDGYGRLRSNDASPIGFFSVRIDAGLKGRIWGLEAWGDFDATAVRRLSAGLTVRGRDIGKAPESLDISRLAAAGRGPPRRQTTGVRVDR